jgi:cell division transport system ATP-binding protein
MLSLKNVCKRYDDQVSVLEQVNLHLQKGEFLYVLGGTGAGKSTLLRLLATEDSPTVGAVELFGYEVSRVSPGVLRSIRKVIGYIPQDVRLIADMSVFDNVCLGALSGRASLSAKELKQSTKELLAILGLERKWQQPCSALSGGEKQRVAVARALVRSPEFIIADEPTGAQDREYTWALMHLLEKANRSGTTVVVATHDPEIVKRVRRRCVYLKNGRVKTEDLRC